MIYSMTGFGRGEKSTGRKKITIEIKTLNSKQLDLSVRMPGVWRELEVALRPRLSAAIMRGKAEMTASLENIGGDTGVCINSAILESYRNQIQEISRQTGIPEPADWYSVLMRLPDVLRQPEENNRDEEALAIVAATEEALASLVAFRKREGEKLEVFFRKSIADLSALLDEVEPLESERVPRVRQRLEEQLARISAPDYDRDRLEQELIYYIEKLDVTEEKTRLRAHLTYFSDTLDLPEGGQGKKLGFIAQEMGREINTLGSKANHAGIQRLVVRMKDILEQIKEQVLNVL